MVVREAFKKNIHNSGGGVRSKRENRPISVKAPSRDVITDFIPNPVLGLGSDTPLGSRLSEAQDASVPFPATFLCQQCPGLARGWPISTPHFT